MAMGKTDRAPSSDGTQCSPGRKIYEYSWHFLAPTYAMMYGGHDDTSRYYEQRMLNAQESTE